MGRELTNR